MIIKSTLLPFHQMENMQQIGLMTRLSKYGISNKWKTNLHWIVSYTIMQIVMKEWLQVLSLFVFLRMEKFRCGMRDGYIIIWNFEDDIKVILNGIISKTWSKIKIFIYKCITFVHVQDIRSDFLSKGVESGWGSSLIH